jgi:mannan endo-1,4-beta-mannosidase
MRARTARELRAPRRWRDRTTVTRAAAAAAGILLAVAVTVALVLHGSTGGDPPASNYLGVFTPGAPRSYTSVQAFATATGVKPGVVVYYSGWREPFQRDFAVAVARHKAVPLVQIDPTRVSLRAIAAGRYDAYLRSYAAAVKAFGGRVILSFGHEMNAWWYGWGYRHTSPAVFIAAWRHIVTVFRHQGASNVIWLWTVNVIDHHARILSPGPWWPGSSYVTWVGIDGYYSKPSLTFAPLFGPTIKAVRRLTLDPVLISETAAPVSTAQPAKIANLFAGVRAYGLLGFVWFNAPGHQNWRMAGPASFAAFRHGARTYRPPRS